MRSPSKQFPGKFSCPTSCGPSDYCKGGRCDREGCYRPRIRTRRPVYRYRNP